MKIRRVKDKPMELHTKGSPKLRIRSGKKQIKGKSTARKVKHSPLSGTKRKVRDSGVSITLRKQSLYTMGRIGAKKASDQIEGGEELTESAGLTAFALSSAYSGANRMSRIYRRKKQSGQMKAAIKNESISDRAKTNGSKGYIKGRDTGSGTSSDIERKKYVVKAKDSNVKKQKGKGGTSSGGKGGRKQGFVKARMLEAFLKARREEDNQTNATQTVKEAVKVRALLLIKKIAATVLPAFLGVFAVVALVGTIVVAVLAVIYNSPLSVFFPLPDTGYDDPRTVLSSYYMEFNQQIMEMEDDGEDITYQNTENGAPVSNFNDTLMVYMILYSDGKAGYVMDEEGKKNLKKIFDEMNYIDKESSATEKEVGDSLGKVWVTAYCPCSQCCGPYANGITASGKTARAKHTIAVDAYNPIVPMGTKVVIEGITYTVEDTGNLNHYGNDFDIFFAHHSDTGQWGRRHVEAYLAEGNTNKVMVTSSGTTVHNLTYEDYIKKGTLTKEQEEMLTDMMDSDLWNQYYSGAAGQAVSERAMTKIGCRYDQNRRYEEGYYDCSSLVQRLYKEVGIELPATASEQGRYCYQNAMLINKKDLKPGDLIFYSYEDNGQFRNISHVAIYVGNGRMVHAANPERGVVLDPLRDGSVVFYARPYK